MNIIVIFMLYVFYLFIYSLSKYLFTFLFDYLLYQKLHGLLKYQSVIRETMPKPHHYTLHLLSPSQQSQIRFGSLSFFLTKHNRHSHRHLNLIYGTSIKAVLMKSLNLHSSEISNHRKVDQIVKKKKFKIQIKIILTVEKYPVILVWKQRYQSWQALQMVVFIYILSPKFLKM